MTNVRYRFGRHALDLAKRELLHDDAAVALPARVFECLVHLIEQRERAVERVELEQAVVCSEDRRGGTGFVVRIRALWWLFYLRRSRLKRCALLTVVQTCALPIWG